MRNPNSSPLLHQQGFTLVELVMVIVIIGVIGGMVAVFMKGPIDAYIDSGRRAALTDVADTVVRRMARDLQRALPNSIRTSTAGGTNCLEFIPTKTGGRYRETDAGALDFDTGSASFNMLGSNEALPADQRVEQSDVIVVYNLGYAPAVVYTGSNWETVSAATTEAGTPLETTISLSSTKVFPLDSGTKRFHVVPGAERMVSYVCSSSDNTLRRTASAAFTATASCPATGPVIANNVNCATTSTWFKYETIGALPLNALVSMALTLRDASLTESITLQHEVHVSNTP